MEPAIHDKDRIFVETYSDPAKSISRGDIIVFRHNDQLFIKRVIALPGETVEGKEHTVIINGKRLGEPYVKHEAENDSFDTFPLRTIPAGQLFVMGDYRKLSSDSRFDEFGPVRVSDVVGRVIKTY